MVKVECGSCGHTWDSSAKKPRCKCDSYDVTEIGEESSPESGEEIEESTGTDREEIESGSRATEPASDSSSEESGGFSLGLFETEEESGGEIEEAPPEIGGTSESSEESSEEEEGDGEPDPEIPELDPEDIRPMFELAFGEEDPADYDEPQDGILSRKQGGHYRMREHELDRLSKSWCRVANKYAPYLMAEYTVEGMAIMTTAMIMMPRIREDQRRKERREAAARDDRAGAATERTETSTEPATDDVSGETDGLTGSGPADTATAFDSL